jgi:simple sugar transport system ATP-binding protein
MCRRAFEQIRDLEMTNDVAGRDGAPPLVVLEQVTKRFPGVLANDSVDLDLREGEVHALIGENGAGKSTLMRVLYGMYPLDSGRILLRGQEVKIGSPRDAIALGIGMVHQHFILVDPFTVTENVILGDEGGAILDGEASERRVGELAQSYGFQIDPKAKVENLSVGEEQRVEILKALYRGVAILILDEPTAVLTPTETVDLFANLRRLRDDGKTIVFISHKLDEVLEIADRITVLRRGRVVGETRPADTSKPKLAEMMVGRPVLFRLEKPEVQIGEPILHLQALEGEGKLNGVSLDVHAGEILGVAGVEGNGQRELAEVVMGLRTPSAGRVILDGDDITDRAVRQIRNAGVGYIPEDRHEQGLVLDMSVWENAVLGREDDRPFSSRWGVLSLRKIKQLAESLVKLFDVRTRSIDASASTLSGGNQQKLILARELDPDPKLLVASQPTRGLDVGAIEFVWRQILEQKAAGRAVLLISAELDEIYALSDRIITLYEGKITGEFPPDTPPEVLGRAMLGETMVQSG